MVIGCKKVAEFYHLPIMSKNRSEWVNRALCYYDVTYRVYWSNIYFWLDVKHSFRHWARVKIEKNVNAFIRLFCIGKSITRHRMWKIPEFEVISS